MSRIQDLTDHLYDLLDRTGMERNDFIALAVIGESHRQALALCGEAPPRATEVHQRWLARLKEIAADKTRPWLVTFSELNEDLNSVWRELKEAADKPDVGACADAFDGVEEVMAVATVCAHIGWLRAQEFEELASRAEAEARKLAPRMPELWEYAYQRFARALPDGEFPRSHAWLELFARLAPVRVAVASASRLYSPEKRAQVALRAVNKILLPDTSSVWETLKAALAPPAVRRAVRGTQQVVAFVRCNLDRVLSGVQLDAFREYVRNLAVVHVPGAGVPLTAAAPQSLRKEFDFQGGIDIEVHLVWTSAELTVTYRIDPPQTGALVLFLEDAKTGEPLASVAVPADVDSEKTCSVSTKELGFDPTARLWQLRVMLA
jgi:hypothetical protein